MATVPQGRSERRGYKGRGTKITSAMNQVNSWLVVHSQVVCSILQPTKSPVSGSDWKIFISFVKLILILFFLYFMVIFHTLVSRKTYQALLKSLLTRYSSTLPNPLSHGTETRKLLGFDSAAQFHLMILHHLHQASYSCLAIHRVITHYGIMNLAIN